MARPIVPHVLALLLVSVACGAPDGHHSGSASGGGPDEGGPDARSAPAVAAPWTTRFATDGFLIADKIEIRGPNGLLDHVAAQQDPQRFAYRAEHVGGEYRQLWERRPGAVGELRAQLDAWAIVAGSRLLIVEQLAPGPVVVRGRGDVSWHDTATGESGQDAGEHTVVGQRPGER